MKLAPPKILGGVHFQIRSFWSQAQENFTEYFYLSKTQKLSLSIFTCNPTKSSNYTICEMLYASISRVKINALNLHLCSNLRFNQTSASISLSSWNACFVSLWKSRYFILLYYSSSNNRNPAWQMNYANCNQNKWRSTYVYFLAYCGYINTIPETTTRNSFSFLIHM